MGVKDLVTAQHSAKKHFGSTIHATYSNTHAVLHWTLTAVLMGINPDLVHPQSLFFQSVLKRWSHHCGILKRPTEVGTKGSKLPNSF